MKRITLFLFLFVVLIPSVSLSDTFNPETKKIYTKEDIQSLAGAYIYNNVNIKNPAIVDVDGDGIFDILNFTKDGRVAYYKNTGTIEAPHFVLEDPKFDNYKINSMLPAGMPVPIFFADMTGNGNVDVFAVVDSKFDRKTQTRQYKVTTLENTAQLDHYTLITIILILAIIVLIAILVK
jgi:hypothetical protein